MNITYAQRRNLLSGLRRRAKKENIEVSISLWDIEIPDLCPDLKIKIYSAGALGALGRRFESCRPDS